MAAATAAARKLYPTASDDVVRLAAADFLVHVRELRRNGQAAASVSPAVDRAPAGQSGAASAAVAPVCDCGRIMVPVVKKNPKQPDWRCPDKSCDRAVWDRKRGSA